MEMSDQGPRSSAMRSGEVAGPSRPYTASSASRSSGCRMCSDSSSLPPATMRVRGKRPGSTWFRPSRWMSSCAITPSRSCPPVCEGSTQTRPATISMLHGTAGSPVGRIAYRGSASPIPSPTGGTASEGQSACAANVTSISPSAGAGVPAGKGSASKRSCHPGGKAALIARITRTASSVNAAGVASATRTIGGIAANRKTRPSGRPWTSVPSASSGLPYDKESAWR